MCPVFFFELSGEHGEMCAAEAKKCIAAEAGEYRIVSEGPGYIDTYSLVNLLLMVWEWQCLQNVSSV